MEKISMKKIREILRLKEECGLSNREIGRILQISHPVVGEYLNNFRRSGRTYWETIDLPDTQLLELLNRGCRKESKSLSELRELFPRMAIELKKKGVTLQLLWEEYKSDREIFYRYSRFCYHFQVWSENAKIAAHFEHNPGKEMFVDFAGQKWPIYKPDGAIDFEAEIFVSVLGASLYTFVRAVRSQKKDDWIQANVAALDFFGGVPAGIIPDNLKSGVHKADKYEADINPEYEDFARHYGTVIIPARPYKPKDKSLVENAVKLAYQRIFAPLRHQKFTSLAELNQAIIVALEKFNNRMMKTYSKSRKDLFEKLEKSVLLPMPNEHYELRKFFRLKVHNNYHFYSSEDNHYYSVPYQYRGKQVTVVFSGGFIEVFHDNVRIAIHERNKNSGRYTTDRRHMPPSHQTVSGWSPESFITQAAAIGEDVVRMIREVLCRAAHPAQAYKTCMGILHLKKHYGAYRLNAACLYALVQGIHSYKNIRNILENGKDKQRKIIGLPQSLPHHDNIRGSKYYGGNS